ncbi:NAD-dependent succinate-semialdehyde dehydrogenase [Marinobacterium mangrovicola]|uniref:Succinate-semialdehyde dehydrogenase/glutarate-semialdehyde dehydrogenase n=1 Tax=Marinobacterium mangrovicola TaxID=1476959 RepID=A0A4R1H428_9GAMM|nr:NAD-dependent succinate-semialdehyde dehydrogenase [Marinobacterium mangrovicola]TCK16407.1 succinate-semialdehyde dehydrogenase/glutarate-semialdehyde dehydrogenase [Marinobacterium mangrovicola]
MTMYAVTNPATGNMVKSFTQATDEEIRQKIAHAHQAYREWRSSSLDKRTKLLNRVADLYEERRDLLAAIITREMGKPLFQAGIEIDIVTSIYRYYANNGPEFLADEPIALDGPGKAMIRKEGMGVLLGIMPWNFPYYQVARFAAPNIMNGNSLLLKHAPQCPESAKAMEQIFLDAGAAEGLYINVYASNEQTADIIADPLVQGVSLTGSERAGSAVAEVAGRHLKKVVLELGGSDPFIVLSDANMETAVQQALLGRFANAGQACNAAKRIIVESSVYDEFLAAFTQAVESIKVGDPMADDTFMGPLSSELAVESLNAQVRDAINQGARVNTGGYRIERAGAWFMPTILTGVTSEMRVYREELFGPVAIVFNAEDENEAVRLANDSAYGLGAVIQSTDINRARQLADRLDVGMVNINEAPGSAPEIPFGGIKRSGFGRELGRDGMEEFVNRKVVRIGE